MWSPSDWVATDAARVCMVIMNRRVCFCVSLCADHHSRQEEDIYFFNPALTFGSWGYNTSLWKP